MAKLTDLQLVLLSTAASRTDGSLLPPAASVAAQTGRIAQAITTLIRRGLAVETEVANAALAYRNEGEDHFGAVITDVGRVAVGTPTVGKEDSEVSDVLMDRAAGDTQAPCVEVVTSGQPKAGTKQALLVGLLQRESGASLDELVTATGWLPHTTRAALTGLRKKGHVLDKAKVDDVTRYTIAQAA